VSRFAAWIAVDWGTSNLRLWAMDAEGRILAERGSEQGMGRLSPDQFEPALLALCGDLIDPQECTDVVICGMAGARQGWAEAPYLPVPARLSALGAGGVTPPVTSPLISVQILPGLSQAAPADVMRGEETQIAGFAATHPGFDGVLCLPGTHSKWVSVTGGTVTQFRTVMTGELFALLAEQSVLRHSVARAVAGDAPDPEAFAAPFDLAVRQAFAAPEAAFAALFTLRAESLLHATPAGLLRSRLSGILIGMELAAMRDLWSARQASVAVIGAGALTRLYATALAALGVPAQIADGRDLVLGGLRAAFDQRHRQIRTTTT
jgi:2-dehydro-3-deoxygalactonokinase